MRQQYPRTKKPTQGSAFAVSRKDQAATGVSVKMGKDGIIAAQLPAQRASASMSAQVSRQQPQPLATPRLTLSSSTLDAPFLMAVLTSRSLTPLQTQTIMRAPFE
jgi:hypothetical protein